MGGGQSVMRPLSAQKSNTEFTSSLRANLSTAQQSAQLRHSNSYGHLRNGATPNGSSKPVSRPPLHSWCTRDGSTVFVPSIDFSRTGLAEERPQYEITVKLFFLPNKAASCRCAQTREAVKLVLRELHVPSIDLLIVSYPGVAFDAEDEEDDDIELPEIDDQKRPEDTALNGGAEVEDIDTMIQTWECLEELFDEGVIAKLGVSEFGTERLSKFLRKARIRPGVNQINVRDCCVVPKPLILCAKTEGIELLTHNDCSNILPRGTTRELLGSKEDGFGVLEDPAEVGTVDGEALRGDVEPQWVIKYTAVVKNRGVIENKGYFAMAELSN